MHLLTVEFPLWEAKNSDFADPKIIVRKSLLRMWISRASLVSNVLVLGPTVPSGELLYENVSGMHLHMCKYKYVTTEFSLS